MSDPPPLVIDTREKKPYDFSASGFSDVVYEALDVGDYTYDGFADRFAVERKSLDDLANSLGNGRDRFEREIQRAQSLDHFVVVVEANRSQVFNYRNRDSCPNYYSNIHPNSVAATVEQWPGKYDTLEFNWAGDRLGAKQETIRLLDKWYVEATRD